MLIITFSLMLIQLNVQFIVQLNVQFSWMFNPLFNLMYSSVECSIHCSIEFTVQLNVQFIVQLNVQFSWMFNSLWQLNVQFSWMYSSVEYSIHCSIECSTAQLNVQFRSMLGERACQLTKSFIARPTPLKSMLESEKKITYVIKYQERLESCIGYNWSRNEVHHHHYQFILHFLPRLVGMDADPLAGFFIQDIPTNVKIRLIFTRLVIYSEWVVTLAFRENPI